MADEWFLRVADKVYGPVDFGTMREWQREGRVIAQNEIRRGASGEWKLAGTVEELFPRTSPPADRVIRRRTWAELVRETFGIYRRAFPQLFLLALLTAVPSFFLQEAVPFTMPALDGSRPAFPTITPIAVVLLVLLVALWPISAAGLQLAADAAAHRQPQRLRDLFRNAISLWPRMLLLGLLVYGSYFFWMAIPFSAMLSLAAGQPSILSLLLVLVIGAFTVYMNARLFINFLFWQQTGALTGLAAVDALRESKRLARSRPHDPPPDRPLYRGGIVASVWLLLLLSVTVASQIPFMLVRFIGVTDPNQALAIAQRMSTTPQSDTLTIAANVLAALLHALLRPLLAASFVVLYYDAKGGAPAPD